MLVISHYKACSIALFPTMVIHDMDQAPHLILQVGSLSSAPLDEEARKAFDSLEQHLRKGRDGAPWCRWAAQAIDQGTFFVADARAFAGTEAFCALITLAADAFIRQCPPPNTDAFADWTAISTLTVLLRDDLPLVEAEEIVQGQRATLLRRGLMVGLLHPQSTLRPLTPGPDGLPYRATRPFLTVRWAVSGDEVFVGINPELSSLLRVWLWNQVRKKKLRS